METHKANLQEDLTRMDYRKQETELVRFLLDQEEEIEKKLLYYKGYIYDSEKNVLVKVGDKLLNDEGINFASRNFRRFLHKNTATANLDESQVSNLIISFSSSVRRNLLHNLKQFDINSVAVIDEIKNDITDMAFILMSQSIDDKGRDYIHAPRQMREVRSINEEPQKEKKGLTW